MRLIVPPLQFDSAATLFENLPNPNWSRIVKPGSRKFSGFLDGGTSFVGDLRFEGTLRVDGDVSGSVTTPDVVIVGPEATVRATIDARAIQVHGRVIGDVSCSGRIEICPGGAVEGDIRTPCLVIEEGGRFEGRSHTLTRSADKTPVPVEEPGTKEDEQSAVFQDPQPARSRISLWTILGKQMERSEVGTVSEAPPAEE